jgi:hypothetical protein
MSSILSVCLFIYPSACLSACLPACLSLCTSVCLSICLSVCLSVGQSVCLFVTPSFFPVYLLSVRPSVHLYGSLFYLCQSVCVSVHLFCLPIYLPFSFMALATFKATEMLIDKSFIHRYNQIRHELPRQGAKHRPHSAIGRSLGLFPNPFLKK